MADGDRIPKVLVVDDEPNIRELVEVALKFHGCAVAVSASGKDAPHQDAKTMSGWRGITSAGSARMRFFANGCSANSGNTSSPPAMRINSATQRMPVMGGSSHSSK